MGWLLQGTTIHSFADRLRTTPFLISLAYSVRRSFELETLKTDVSYLLLEGIDISYNPSIRYFTGTAAAFR